MRAQLEALELDLLRADSVIPAVKETLGRMERILEGLLALARTSPLKAGPLALIPLVQEVLLALPRMQRERVTFQATDGQSKVVGTPELVKQAVANLLSNALVHGGGQVSVSLCDSPREVAVAVRDEGEGVPEPLLHKLPDPFFQVGGGLGGVGLGLTLVRYIAETLGGRLELRNLPSGFEARLVLRRVPDS